MAHLRIPGNPGDGAVIAHSAAMNESGIIDVRVDAALDAYSGVGGQTMIARWMQGATTRTWACQILNTGVPYVKFQYAVGSIEVVVASAAVATPAGGRVQLRYLLNAPAQTCNFYTRAPGLALPSDTSWSALGTQRPTTASVIYVPADATQMSFGAASSAAPLDTDRAAGNFYAGYFRKGGTTEVVDVDFSDVSTWVYS